MQVTITITRSDTYSVEIPEDFDFEPETGVMDAALTLVEDKEPDEVYIEGVEFVSDAGALIYSETQ